MSMSLCLQATELTREEILGQLEKILCDRRFVTAARNAKFLRYVVEQVLNGQGDQIKEVVVATEVYGRPGNYDPKVDSIVRVEATRLRSKLRDYYQHEGRLDPIRIAIPTGSYVPMFEPVLPAELPSEPAPEECHSAVINSPSGYTGGVHILARAFLFAAVAVILAGLVSLAQYQTADSAARPHPEAIAAWQEGNDLLRQDPHTGASGRGAPQTLLRAIDRYEFAVAQDPSFAPAWASLAEGYEYAFAYVGRNPADDSRRAEAAARRAIALDNNLPAGHAMLALVLACLKWNFTGAETAYRRAIQLDPRNAYAIVEYADLLRETGRVKEAADEIRRARALSPALPILAVKEAEIYLDQNQADAALASASAALQLSSAYLRAHVALGTAWEAKGEWERALTHYRQPLAVHPQDRRALPAYGYLLGVSGRTKEASAVAKQLEEMNSRIRNCAFQIAVVYTGMGEHQLALDWLQRAWETRQMHFPFAAVEYRFRPLHQYERFHALLNRAGLKVVRS